MKGKRDSHNNNDLLNQTMLQLFFNSSSSIQLKKNASTTNSYGSGNILLHFFATFVLYTNTKHFMLFAHKTAKGTIV